jgi:hypothetical protein
MMGVADEAAVRPMTGLENYLKSLKNVLKEVPALVDTVTVRNHRKRPAVACRTTAYSLTSRRMTGQDYARIIGQQTPRHVAGLTGEVSLFLPPPPPVIF